MCVAVAGLTAAKVMAITAAASTALSIASSYSQQRQQAKMAEAQWKMDQERKAKDYQQQTQQITYQQVEANQQAMIEKTERARQAAIE